MGRSAQEESILLVDQLRMITSCCKRVGADDKLNQASISQQTTQTNCSSTHKYGTFNRSHRGDDSNNNQAPTIRDMDGELAVPVALPLLTARCSSLSRHTQCTRRHCERGEQQTHMDGQQHQLPPQPPDT